MFEALNLLLESESIQHNANVLEGSLIRLDYWGVAYSILPEKFLPLTLLRLYKRGQMIASRIIMIRDL